MPKHTWIKLSGYLLISIIVCGLLWSTPGGQAEHLSFAQSPLPTLAVTRDDVDVVNPPRPPTATPTRIPDNEPPVTTLIVNQTSELQHWYSDPVSVTFDAVDNWVGLGLTWHRLGDEANWHIYEYYYPPVVIGEGLHTLYYYSEDSNHNRENLHITRLNVDPTPPTVTHIIQWEHLFNDWYGSPITITVTGQDNLSGINHYEINLDNSGWQTINSDLVISATGHHTLTYRAIDLAGNSSVEDPVMLNVDATPPTTTHTVNGILTPDGWYNSLITVTLVAKDIGASVSNIWYRFEGEPTWREYYGPFVVNIDQHHLLEYYAIDRVNNVEKWRLVDLRQEVHQVYLPLILKTNQTSKME